jgi:hypothetical protein
MTLYMKDNINSSSRSRRVIVAFKMYILDNCDTHVKKKEKEHVIKVYVSFIYIP